MKDCLIGTDFDGHVTDDEAGMPPFREHYMRDFASRLGIGIQEFEPVFDAVVQEVLQNKSTGQEDGGRVMSPMGAYSKFTRATRVILERLRKDPNTLGLELTQSLKQKIPTPEEEKAFLDSLYADNYPYAETIFRPGALGYLRELNEIARLVVITNSRADKVLQRLKSLKGAPEIPVFGGAGKRDWDKESQLQHVHPEHIEVEGLNRKIWIRRPKYYKVLEQIGALSMPKEKVLIAGDNLELDLILPWALGMKVALLDKDEPDKRYEAEFLSTQPNAVVGNTLEELTRKMKATLSPP